MCSFFSALEVMYFSLWVSQSGANILYQFYSAINVLHQNMHGRNIQVCNDNTGLLVISCSIARCINKLNSTRMRKCVKEKFSQDFYNPRSWTSPLFCQQLRRGGLAKGWPMGEEDKKYRPIGIELQHVHGKQRTLRRWLKTPREQNTVVNIIFGFESDN